MISNITLFPSLGFFQVVCNLVFHVSVDVCTLSGGSVFKRCHLITHSPEDEQLVFIKCQYVAWALNKAPDHVASALGETIKQVSSFYLNCWTEMAGVESYVTVAQPHSILENQTFLVSLMEPRRHFCACPLPGTRVAPRAATCKLFC